MNEIITSTPETIPSVEVQDLSNYLNEISMKEPKLHLSILPNLISDCASVFMEYKKMKIDNDQFNKKCRIIDNSLQSQMKNQRESIELNYRQKMQEINANKTTKLFELEAEKEVSLSKIEYRTRKALEEIGSNERMQIAKLKIDYEIKRKAQEDELYKFRENLKEDLIKSTRWLGVNRQRGINL